MIWKHIWTTVIMQIIITMVLQESKTSRVAYKLVFLQRIFCTKKTIWPRRKNQKPNKTKESNYSWVLEAMVISCKYRVRLKHFWSQKRKRSTVKIVIKRYSEKEQSIKAGINKRKLYLQAKQTNWKQSILI